MKTLRFDLGLLLPLFLLLAVCATCAAGSDSLAESNRTALAVEALSRLQGVAIHSNPKLKEAVLKALNKTRGTPSFVKLVQHFKLTDQDAGLLEIAVAQPARDIGVEAVRLILANKNLLLLQSILEGTNAVAATKLVEVLGNAASKQAVPLLVPIVTDSKRDPTLRKQAVRSLARTADGATSLLDLAKEGKLSDDIHFTTSAELNQVRWPEIKEQAAMLLPLARTQNAQPLPPVAELLTMKGDATNGAKIFTRPTVGCANCHVVNGQGTDFGPNLSEVGSKLAKEALYEAILDPSAGISFGYEAWQVNLKSGDEAFGLLVNQTAEEIAIKSVGGIVTRYKKTDIKDRQQMKLSIMPTGLQQMMNTQELVDLVEYLMTLKKR